jgi:hypothetical protein
VGGRGRADLPSACASSAVVRLRWEKRLPLWGQTQSPYLVLTLITPQSCKTTRPEPWGIQRNHCTFNTTIGQGRTGSVSRRAVDMAPGRREGASQLEKRWPRTRWLRSDLGRHCQCPGLAEGGMRSMCAWSWNEWTTERGCWTRLSTAGASREVFCYCCFLLF